MRGLLNIGLRGLDFFFLTRPVLWIPVWGFAAFGYWAAAGDGSLAGLWLGWQRAGWPVFFWIALFSVSVGTVYVLNQIADLEVDGLNEGFALLVHGAVGRRGALFVALAAGLLSAALLYPRDPRLSCCALAAIAVGALYSFKPSYFSGRPVFDFLTNATGYGLIAFGAGWILAGAQLLSPRFALAAAPYFLLMCAGSISSTLPDVPGDRQAGKRTTAVAFGPGRAHGLATLALLLAAGLALWRGDWVALTSATASLPVYLLYCLRRTPRWMEATYKVGGGITMLLAALIFPVMILPSAATFAATWLYFRFRHGVRYPSLLPATHVDKAR